MVTPIHLNPTSPISGDTASLGCQTEPIAGRSTPPPVTSLNTPRPPDTRDGCDSASGKGFSRQRPRSDFVPTASRIAHPLTFRGTPTPPAKRRRGITHTNFTDSPTSSQILATDFDLTNFMIGPLTLPGGSLEEVNDDLIIEHYRPAPRSYSGSQRRGISEPFPTATSYEEHIEGALNATFPLHEPAPLPKGLELALEFNRVNDLGEIRQYRQHQMEILRSIAEETKSSTLKMYKKTPESIRSATGRVRIAMIAHLVKFTRMNGSKWVGQFVTGFPITGCLQQAHTFPLDEGIPTTFVDPVKLFTTNTARFRARAPRDISPKAGQLWGEAMEQVNSGWLAPPEPLDDAGNFLDRPKERINTAFRFGVTI